MLQVDLEIEHANCRLLQVLEPSGYAMQVSADDDADILLARGSPQQVVGVIGLFAAQPTFAVLHREPGCVLLRMRNLPTGIIAAIIGLGCAILWPTVYRDGIERYRVVVSSPRRLASLVRTLQGHGVVRVVRTAPLDVAGLGVDLPLTDIAGQLTPRQLAVVQAAVALGYYDVPRRADMQELAAHLGLARSTAEEHLRKAERVLIVGLARALAVRASGDVARKGPGRPARMDVAKRPAMVGRMAPP